VALKMVILGDKPADADMVYSKLSEMAQKDINATVDVQNITWGDMGTKYPLLFSSGSDYDIVFSCSWTGYQTYQAKGAFLPISMDMVKAAAPNTYKNTPQAAWDQTKALDGNNYLIPEPVKEYPGKVYLIRGDLRAKYNLPPIKSFDDFVKYMDAVAKNEKDIIPYALGSSETFMTTYFQPDPKNLFNSGYIDASISSVVSIPLWAKKGEVKYSFILDEPWFKNYVDTMNDWRNKGYWSQNSLVQNDPSTTMFENGKSAVCYWSLDQIGNMISRINIANPSWKPEIVNLDDIVGMPQVPSKYDQNGLSINANTKNPERALMLIDLLKYNKDYFDLTWYGINGVHYQPVGTDKYKPLADSSKYPPGGNCPWGWRTELERWDVTKPTELLDILNNWKAKYTAYPDIYSYTGDSKGPNLDNETASLTDLAGKYILPMAKGFMDYNTGSTKLRDLADKAGLKTYMTAAQEMVDRWQK